MEFPKRERAFLEGSPRRSRSPKATRPGAATGPDENASPKHLVAVGAASPSPQRKKVLGERNDGGVGGMESAASPPVQQPKPAPSSTTLAGRGKGPYDPKTNYTTPRPAFLRYDPERRREILLRVSRAAEVYDDCSSTTSGTAASEEDGDSLASDAVAASPISSAPSSDSEAELDDGEEEEVVPARRGGWARRLFLLLVAVSCSLCYICCMNPAAFPTDSEDALDFVGGIGGLYDGGDHELESLRLLAPVYMMGPDDVLKGMTNQIVQEDTKSVASSRNLVSVTVMGLGLTDICLNVSLGELKCQIGSGRSDNLADLREDSEMDKLDTEVAISFQNDKQSSEVDCLDGNAPLDSVSSTTTHTNEEDCSNQCVQQLVSVEKVIKSASDKMEGRKGLESEQLNLWQYENTAEAAKRVCSVVKFLWSAVEPHLLQILACLSFAGLVAACALYRCYQRSRESSTCITTYDSPPEAEHQFVQLSVTSSVQDVQLPVLSPEQPLQLTIPNQGLPGSLEVPIELTLPKLDPLVSLEDPEQEPLPKTDPLVTLRVPVIGHGIHDQKLKQGDSENMKMKASSGRFLNHSDVESSKAPVVEVLGEFMFANSSRGRSIKRLDQNAGDATVQELLEHLGKDEDIDKMQVHSSIIQSPSVRRAKGEQEKSVKGEKTNATLAPLTPTPLRRSSRLRNKVTSP